jgi:hypothetical protein
MIVREKVYTDSDGRECTLSAMCRREPEWAASRVGTMTTKLDAIGALLAANGCDCECGHDVESHDDDECERCLGCRIGAVLG